MRAVWHWDQGHLEYFQFDALRQIASYVTANDFRAASRLEIEIGTGLDFAAPRNYSPWRNYGRVLKHCLLVSELGGKVAATPVAHALSAAGAVTCDEFLHFLVQVSTEPSPALKDWQPNAVFSYPLLFALKYLLAKCALSADQVTSFDELIGAYCSTKFTGGEDDNKFIEVISNAAAYRQAGKSLRDDQKRQAKESLKVISQISYLYLEKDNILVALTKEDAMNMLQDLKLIDGPRADNKDAEIRRLAGFFSAVGNADLFTYPNTVVDEVVQSGFAEGTKVKKTHVTIERNSRLRQAFFAAKPKTVTCDVCTLDTAKTYPWTTRVLDLHHLLPLSSGTQVVKTGTTFEDLVPICPNCHRAVHQFYNTWLKEAGKQDFLNRLEARSVYSIVKTKFLSASYA